MLLACQEDSFFDGITVSEDDDIIVARNVDGRVLLKINLVANRMYSFRSKRMTGEEIEFCLLMMEKFFPVDLDPEKKEELLRFLRYETDGDVYCI